MEPRVFDPHRPIAAAVVDAALAIVDTPDHVQTTLRTAALKLRQAEGRVIEIYTYPEETWLGRAGTRRSSARS